MKTSDRLILERVRDKCRAMRNDSSIKLLGIRAVRIYTREGASVLVEAQLRDDPLRLKVGIVSNAKMPKENEAELQHLISAAGNQALVGQNFVREPRPEKDVFLFATVKVSTPEPTEHELNQIGSLATTACEIVRNYESVRDGFPQRS